MVTSAPDAFGPKFDKLEEELYFCLNARANNPSLVLDRIFEELLLALTTDPNFDPRFVFEGFFLNMDAKLSAPPGPGGTVEPPPPSDRLSGAASRAAFKGWVAEEPVFQKLICDIEEFCLSAAPGAQAAFPSPLGLQRLGSPLEFCTILATSGLFIAIFLKRGLLSKARPSMITSSSTSFKTSDADLFKAS
jgi:hypothetical protein